jgi:hypothetical protein
MKTNSGRGRACRAVARLEQACPCHLGQGRHGGIPSGLRGRRENSKEDRKFCKDEITALALSLQPHPLQLGLRGNEEGCKVGAVCSGEGR